MSPHRLDGWVPIADYGVLGNGHTVAMVALDGQIDWWPLPALDDPPAFAAILDPINGGRLKMQPADDFTVTRRYVGESNVLETTFRTPTGTARLTDALTIGRAGVPLPWGELVRRVEGVDGQVAMRWAVHPGTRFGTTQPWTQQRGDDIVMHCGDQHLALRCFDLGTPTVTPHEVSGAFTTSVTSTGIFAISASDNAPIYLPGQAALESRLDATVSNWHNWSAAMTYDGPWAHAVRRSGLVLKLLLYSPTGAIAAAATTSLPERIGGDKNWDYRYMWIRDTSYTVDACIQLGLEEEVQGAVASLLRSVRSTLPGLNVFYRLDGNPPDKERDLDAPGYRGSRPVRAGNQAASQTQLGTFGDLFDSIWRYVRDGHLLDPATAEMLADLADRCCDIWRSKDAGIWELKAQEHYTSSKIGCWVALDRAVHLHDQGQVPTTRADRWRAERDAIKAWVNEHCWSADKCSYTFFAGSDQLDASVLLAGMNGFDRGERLAGTVEAVKRELSAGPLVYRYTGMDKEEGAFLACSFWMVAALAALDRLDEATALMDQAVSLSNDLGLMAEQMDPESREMLGNVPQGLSHLALVNSAFAVARAKQRAR
ncbi:MAG TPA: glycoside hydrolase family 15 protein [Mycobacteriales bacterium]